MSKTTQNTPAQKETVTLNSHNLNSIASAVKVPNYERSRISPGMVHIGMGNFHRAHQAVYMDRLFDLGQDFDWGIIGAGVKSYDEVMRLHLVGQDWLYSVIELDPEVNSARICGSMVDFVEVNSNSLVEQLVRHEIRIVSLTITEGGYFRDEKTGEFNTAHPEIIHDSENPKAPQTVFGILLAALQRRREIGLPPFTVMSCDNLPHNGDVTRQAVVGLARLSSIELSDWIEAEVSFPNSMVDCITPATGERERKLANDEFGIDDASPVVCEPFRQWVLEDRFPQGRPALEKVGVEFVDDVAPYELMKLRFLNGGHAAIAYPAALLGIKYVHEAMADALVAGFMSKLIEEEVIPIVPPVAGFDFYAYFNKVCERFSNPKIGDTISRLCMDGSNRQPKFILPSVSDRLQLDLPINGLALEVALWCRYCAGENDSGNAIEILDGNAGRLQALALKTRKQPGAFFELVDVFGPLAVDSVFVESFSHAITSLWSKGVVETLQEYISESDLKSS
jgi:mannitol 2-dehydrogenase